MHIDFANIPDYVAKAVELPDAQFLHYKPEFPKLKHAWKEFGSFHNIIVIGHGGSVTTFLGMYQALGTEKNVCVLSTTDPEYIAEVKKTFKKAETLIIAISKSGQDNTQIEALLHFIDNPAIFITEKGTTLEAIAKKLNAKIYQHPPIGGRYTGFTEVALVPAIICGLDIEKIVIAGQHMLDQYRLSNIAMQTAQVFYALEQKGYVDVFIPIYSHNLFSFRNLIMQLCHESFGKGGQGQTYIAQEGPEWQHHTMQRFFGGRKNAAGFFISLDNYRDDLPTTVPHGMQTIPMKNGSLYDLHNLPLSYSMHSECKASWEDTKINSIPAVHMILSAITPEEVGTFIAFWQLYAVYSSVLRGVDPFDQPAVENSKKISWTKRQEYKR